jgi:hypothetical protein
MNFTLMMKTEILVIQTERDSDIQTDAARVSVYRVNWTSELKPDRGRDKM